MGLFQKRELVGDHSVSMSKTECTWESNRYNRHTVKLLIASIGNRPGGNAFDQLTKLYCDRSSAYCVVERQTFRSEDTLFEWVEKQRGRTAPVLVMLDSRGKAHRSEDLARWLGQQRDAGQQTLIFALGPADGWSVSARARAGLLLSFGPMTLPHELAQVVLAEQIYRAFTILAGHPYHSGH
jgi:23S rRNA (pseudouridine1915-N3)-methyltransferase